MNRTTILLIRNKQNGIIPLCRVLLLIGTIAILSACMNVNGQEPPQTSNNNPLPSSNSSSSNREDDNGKENVMANSDPVIESEQSEAELAEEQAKILEILLFFGVGDSQHVMDTDQKTWEDLLKNKVSQKAAQRESFKYVQETKAQFSRPFYSSVSDVRLNEQKNELFFTFNAYLFYSIGQELKLEVYMVKEGDTWKFEDFGSLYIEEYRDVHEANITNKEFPKDFE